MIDFLLTAVGLFIILQATEVGRKEDSKIEPWSTDFNWMCLMILVGVLLCKIG
jgi:hypothetical protein